MSDDDDDDEIDDEGFSEHFSIKVVDDDGDGISAAIVNCVYGVGGGSTRVTDDDGWVTFPIIRGSMCEVVEYIRINYKFVDVESFSPVDGETFSFTEPDDDDD